MLHDSTRLRTPLDTYTPQNVESSTYPFFHSLPLLIGKIFKARNRSKQLEINQNRSPGFCRTMLLVHRWCKREMLPTSCNGGRFKTSFGEFFARQTRTCFSFSLLESVDFFFCWLLILGGVALCVSGRSWEEKEGPKRSNLKECNSFFCSSETCFCSSSTLRSETCALCFHSSICITINLPYLRHINEKNIELL